MNLPNYQIYRQPRQAIIANYVPDRPPSVGKENMYLKPSTSMSQVKNISNDPYRAELQQLKLQIIQIQQEQNTFNEHQAKQINCIFERQSKTESIIKQLIDSGALQKNISRDDLIDMQNHVNSQINSLQQSVKDSQKAFQLFLNSTVAQTHSQIQSLKKEFASLTGASQNSDIQRFEQFNQSVSQYLELRPEAQKYRCQLSAIQESTLEESIVQSTRPPITQFELDKQGYLISDGQYIMDESGNKYQLTPEQVVYLKSINVLEEI